MNDLNQSQEPINTSGQKIILKALALLKVTVLAQLLVIPHEII